MPDVIDIHGVKRDEAGPSRATAQEPGIFISYRRTDAEGWAGRLSDSLKIDLPRIRIFRDIEDIPPGVEFDAYITAAVTSCNVLIALIGPQWLSVTDKDGRRRLEEPHDFTRNEIAIALQRNVRVIPALVGGAKIPSAEELPEDLKPLARRQAYELTDGRWADDCRKLAAVLKPLVKPASRPPRKTMIGAGVIVIVLLLLGAAVLAWVRGKSSAGSSASGENRSTQSSYDSRAAGDHPSADPGTKETGVGGDDFDVAVKAYQEKRFPEAQRSFEKAANAGSAVAMNNLGYMYMHGVGGPQDFAKARRWFEKSANAGNPDAMGNLGILYVQGQGVSQDYQQGRQWLEKSAAGGNAQAMFNVGVLYDNGSGVVKDPVQARKWFEKAALGGHPAAMSRLGYLYLVGQAGLSPDSTQGRLWLEKAAAAGDTKAMWGLGLIYQEGAGVPKDANLARQWYQKAADAGDEDAKKRLQAMSQ